MRKTHRLDANHKELRQAAEKLGWLWEDTSQTGLGYDALITIQGRTVRAEIKDGRKPPSAQKLTPHEERVHQKLKAHGVLVELLTCVDDLQMLHRELRSRREERG